MDLDFDRIAATVIRVLRETDAAREETASFAVREALRLLVEGGAPRGLASLDYARRLAPSDGAIAFAIGLVRLAVGDRRASESLEPLVERSGSRDVQVHLVMARRRFGEPDRAAAELHRLLRANAPEPGAAFAGLAEAVAGEAGRLGWCGLDNAGRVSIGGAAASLPAADIAILLDGTPVRLRRWRAAGSIRQGRLPDGWARARRLSVTATGQPLIGSPIDVAQVTRMDGFVATTEAGGISGWCWLPGEREAAPRLTLHSLVDPEQFLVVRAERPLEAPTGFADFAAPRQFLVPSADLERLAGPLEVRGPHGRVLCGSPVRPLAAIDSARAAARAVAGLYPADNSPPRADARAREPSIPASLRVTRPQSANPPAPRGIDVIIPVDRELAITMACLDSVLAARAAHQGALDERIVVVVDASPEAELLARLQAVAETGAIVLSHGTVSSGLPAIANIGLRMTARRDAVLLNSDTLVPPGWLARLRDAAHSAHDIGTATPLSNDAALFSYPRADAANPPPGLAEVTQIAALAHQANGGIIVDAPTGQGRCLYIRAECLAETGVLRDDVFAQGHGEENDFCMRARVFGWRHVGVPGAFVGHVGGQPFAAPRTHLIERNLATLNRLHVGYDRLVSDWLRADPLADSRRRVDRLRFLHAAGGGRSVLLVSHSRGGGALRHVRERAALHEQAGEHALLLRPGRDAEGGLFCTVAREMGDPTPNLRFRLPAETEALHALLREARVRLIELHHFIGHHEDVLRLVREFGCPYDVYVHDYAWFCPRVTLTDGANRYCGEPPVSGCARCVADHGNSIDEDIAPVMLRVRSAGLLQGARTVVAPSWDAARRMERHFRLDVSVGVWERALALPPDPPAPRGDRRRRVCVVGAIGLENGYEMLLGVARHAAERDLPLEFVLVGHSCDDMRLLETGRVSITGRYAEPEAVRLIREQDADFAFLPAPGPEAWSYVLSRIWEAGLPVVAHDIGAPAERIRATGGGVVLPLHMSAAKLAQALVEPGLFERAAGRAGAALGPTADRAAGASGLRHSGRIEAALPGGMVLALEGGVESFFSQPPP